MVSASGLYVAEVREERELGANTGLTPLATEAI